MIHRFDAHPCLPKLYLIEKQQMLGGNSLAALECLKAEFNIDYHRHPTYANLYQLTYGRDAEFHEPIVQQCRGLILDSFRQWTVIARPFDKFFNYGEPLAPRLDWANARAFEKLDGSLMIFYWYGDQWHVATKGSPDAGGQVNGFNITFRELFWNAWAAKGYPLPPAYRKCYTLMFELTSPLNRVVVKHTDIDLRLIAVRSIYSGEEQSTEWFPEYMPVAGYRMHNIQEAYDTFPDMDPFEQEGYVVVDQYYNRLKVKNPRYVAMHHLRDSLTPRRVLEVVRAGETGEVLAHFPEWKGLFDQVQAGYDGLVLILKQDYENIKHIVDRKLFAEQAMGSVHPGTLFALRDGKASTVQEALRKMHIDHLMKLLGIEANAFPQLEVAE